MKLQSTFNQRPASQILPSASRERVYVIGSIRPWLAEGNGP
jgi:hypothetical protein